MASHKKTCQSQQQTVLVATDIWKGETLNLVLNKQAFVTGSRCIYCIAVVVKIVIMNGEVITCEFLQVHAPFIINITILNLYT